MKKRYWIGIAISVFLLYLTFRSVEMASVASAFAGANFALLIPALALYFAGVFVRSVRWGLLLRPVKRLTQKRLFVVMAVGFMANDVLPLRAGEAVRAYMLWQKERLAPGATVATIVVERLLDGLVLTGFLVVSGLLMPLDLWMTQLAWIAGAVFLGCIVLVFAMTVAPGPISALGEKLLSPMPARLRNLGLKLLRTFVDGLASLRSVSATASVVGLSCLAWILEAGMYFVLMFSFPFAPSFLASILGAAVANLGTMVPSSPGYVGTFDLPLSAVLVGSFHIAPSLATGYTLLVHAALILPISLLGLLFVWREGLSLSGMTSTTPSSQVDEEDPPLPTGPLSTL
jgi:glycosyltransferase 2 family protein